MHSLVVPLAEAIDYEARGACRRLRSTVRLHA
jgi:hypothetical protein